MATALGESSASSTWHGAAPSVAATCVWPFLEVARSLGDPVEMGLAYVGLNEEEVRRPGARLPHSQLMKLLAITIAACGRPERGLLAAEQLQPAHFGLLEFAARSQPTVRGALRILERHWSLVHDACTLEVRTEHSDAFLVPRLGNGLRWHPAAMEFTLAAFSRALRHITGEALRVREVHLAHPAPADVSAHERIFQCPLVFGGGESALVVADRDLDLPLVWADELTSDALERSAEEVQRRLRHSDRWETRVATAAARQLAAGHCSAEAVAREMGVTLRTLQRKLASEGTGVRTVLEQERARVADNYLRHTDLSLDEIAERLGYSGAPGLHRAIKRWTGRTLANHRRALRASDT